MPIPAPSFVGPTKFLSVPSFAVSAPVDSYDTTEPKLGVWKKAKMEEEEQGVAEEEEEPVLSDAALADAVVTALDEKDFQRLCEGGF